MKQYQFDLIHWVDHNMGATMTGLNVKGQDGWHIVGVVNGNILLEREIEPEPSEDYPGQLRDMAGLPKSDN